MAAVHAHVGAEGLGGGPPGPRVAVAAAGQRAVAGTALDGHAFDGVALLDVVDILEEVQVEAIAIRGLH